MDYRTAHLRRLRHSKRLQKRLATMALLGVLACTTVLLLVRQPELWSSPASASVDAAPTGPVIAAAVLRTPIAPSKSRRVYPFSIVPGGIADRTELVHILKVDKVVAAHYAAFEVARTHPVRVAAPRAVYVSYRKGDKVYWTSKKVTLAAGETLLSDGANEIRTRCGNRISDVARLPVAADEPAADVLDTAMDAGQDDAGVQQASAAADGAPGAGQAHSLTVFPHGAGLLGSRNATALAMLGMAGTANGGRAPVRALGIADALPLVKLAAPGAPDGATSGSAASTAPSATSTTASTTASGPVAYATMSGNSGGTPVNPESATLLAGDASDAGGVGGSAPTGMSTPMLGPADDPIADARPALPVRQDALSPQPDGLLPVVKPAADNGTVPEPGTLWLCGAALAAIPLLRRRAR